ncbi:hypothetical protein V8J88_10645 [Massilia sp. W12]
MYFVDSLLVVMVVFLGVQIGGISGVPIGSFSCAPRNSLRKEKR